LLYRLSYPGSPFQKMLFISFLIKLEV
jgi:hypothetical protein